ncbi:TfoX N-terminal domain-containing protein [Mycobacteroides abscessus]|nr:TfoX N-terminal domain-containing protein [Mycobacteroides abscessus]
MAYDEDLVERIREVIATTKGVTEKRMFGGLAFLVHGHMTVAAKREGGLLARCDPHDTEALVAKPHVGRMVMGGREMDGWLSIDAEGVAPGDNWNRGSNARWRTPAHFHPSSPRRA